MLTVIAAAATLMAPAPQLALFEGQQTASSNAGTHTSHSRWRAAIHVGHSKQQGSSNLSGVDSANVLGVDDEGGSWGVTLNYFFSPDWALELGYVDLGEGSATLKGSTENYHQAVSQATPVLGEGVTFGIQYRLWHTKAISLERDGGAIAWQSDLSSHFNGVTITHEDDGVDPYASIAAHYQLGDGFAAHIGYARYFLKPNDVDNFRIGFSLAF